MALEFFFTTDDSSGFSEFCMCDGVFSMLVEEWFDTLSWIWQSVKPDCRKVKEFINVLQNQKINKNQSTGFLSQAWPTTWKINNVKNFQDAKGTQISRKLMHIMFSACGWLLNCGGTSPTVVLARGKPEPSQRHRLSHCLLRLIWREVGWCNVREIIV